MAIVNKSMLLVFRGNSKSNLYDISVKAINFACIIVCRIFMLCCRTSVSLFYMMFGWESVQQLHTYSFRSKQEFPSWLLQCTNIHCIIGVISFLSLSLWKFRSLICAHFISFSLIISLFKKAENNIQAQLASSYHIVVLNKQ